MILPFKKQFEKPILDNIKIHTIREDKKNRWKAGNLIHFATGVRTKNYHRFKMDICKSTQTIKIRYIERFVSIEVDGRELTWTEKYELAKNDGFERIDQLLNWFNTDFTGKIIHWTDFRY